VGGWSEEGVWMEDERGGREELFRLGLGDRWTDGDYDSLTQNTHRCMTDKPTLCFCSEADRRKSPSPL